MVVKIESLDSFGRGITKIDGKVCFVKNALPNEVVEISILEDKKKYSIAKVNSYIKISEKRIQPLCPYYEECGGCHLGHLRYEDQLAWKEKCVLEQMKRKVHQNFTYLGIVEGDAYHYRNKIVFHSDGRQLGFYQEKSHQFVPIKSCLLANEKINQMIPKLPIEESLLVRISNCSDEMIIGKEEKPILSQIGKYQFSISSESFFQVNDAVTKKLYDYIYEIVKIKKPKQVLDLYCGIGTIGIYIHDLVERVVGVEIIKEAIQDANYNKKLNQVDNISFLCGDVGDYIDQFENEYDLVIVDPPRKGLKKNVLSQLKRIHAQSIIYVSCNKTTLMRDLNDLSSHYDVDSLKLFDMFPNTYHVECVCVLNRR